MTTLQKTIIGVALTAAVGTGIYEARHASSLRSRVQTLQQQQTPLAAQIQRLQKELADAATKLAALQQENGQLRKDTAELARLRGEVARWRAEFQDLARSKLEQSKSEPESEEESWLNRIKLLKQKVDQTPGARIPEMKYLKEEDWLRVAKHKLDTDDDYRVALSDLRTTSEGAFLNLAETALRKYVDANNGQFPTDLLELKSFFSDPVDDEALQRYQIVPAASVPQGNLAGPASDWLITLKNPQDDAALALGRNGVSSFSYSNSPTMDILAPAIRALFDNTPVINGRKQINMKELLPYLTTPEQKAAYEKMVQDSK
jgi:hypothetical protein